MKRSYFKEEKERDFIRAYEEEMKDLGDMAAFVPREKLIMKTLYSGKGRYYITFEEAVRNVYKIINHMPVRCKNHCKIEMYEEMARKVVDYMHRHPSADYRSALYRVLAESRASRFFFGLQTARLILYNHYRQRRVAERRKNMLRVGESV